MVKVKFFSKVGQKSRSRSRGKNFVSNRKVLPQEKHMWNVKALSLLVEKLWPRLTFFKSRSKVKVKVKKSNILVSTERFCHKEYTYVILKLYLFLLKSYG